MKEFWLSLCLPFMLAPLAQADGDQPLQVADLAGAYILVELGGVLIEAERPLRIHSDGTVWGHGGCNGGSLQIDPTLRHWSPIRPLRATQRFCPPENSDPVPEFLYFSLLSGQYDWTLIRGQLALYPHGQPQGIPSAIFERIQETGNETSNPPQD